MYPNTPLIPCDTAGFPSWLRGFYYHQIQDITFDLVEQGTNIPVTLEEMKTHLIIEDDSWDDYVNSLLSSATAHCERYTGRSIFGSTWVQYQERFERRQSLYYPQLDEVTKVEYANTSGNYIEISAGNYKSMGCWDRSTLWFSATNIIPVTEAYNPFAIKITYSTKPFNDPALQHAIKLIVGEWFAQRSNTSEVQTYKIPTGVCNLLDPLKVGGMW